MKRPVSDTPGPDLLVVGANPAVDVYYQIDRLCVGGVNRVRTVRAAAGGKANNLARAYQRLGGLPMTTGVAGGETGRRILAGLSEEGIRHDYVAGDGESRQTVTVVDGGATTVLLEPGPSAEPAALDALAAKVAAWSPVVPAVALAGSLPPGAPPDFLARLVQVVRQSSAAFVAIDASGEALRLGGLAGPDLVKVNVEEFERAFARPVDGLLEIESAFRLLAEHGVRTLCLTGGPRGALVHSADDRFAVRTEGGEPVSTAGAGDAFLAGYLLALRQGDEPRLAARLASAAAAAALQAIGAGFIDRVTVESFLPRTQVGDAGEFFVGWRP